MVTLIAVLDKQQNKTLSIYPTLAEHLAINYPCRFVVKNPTELRKVVNQMARIAQKHPVLFQQKLTLEEVKDEELTLVALEEKEGTSGTYMLLRVKRANGETGYISMGFAPIVDALKGVDVKKELPGEITFTKSGTSWIMK